MAAIFKGGSVWTRKNGFVRADISVARGAIVSLGRLDAAPGDTVVSIPNMLVMPGFADAHTHLREPGFSHKETIASGTRAAARGGYTLLGAMPNLDPVPDCRESLSAELDRIERDAIIGVLPYGAITKGRKGRELADMEAMAGGVIGFSDDGTGVNDESVLLSAMREAARLHKVIAAHSEDPSRIPPGGCVHDGAFAKARGFTGIPSESEWQPIERDLRLLRETDCAWHVCHVSARESVDAIRRAKAEGANVTCETAPHYLLLDDSMIEDDGRFKMNPPIRSKEDRLALIEALADGTIDMIATDHAPHSAREKAGGLRGSAMGVVGLETAFPLLYDRLVLPGKIPMKRLMDAMTAAPRARFGLPGREIALGASADFTVFDPADEGVVRSGEFRSMGRSTPFEGWKRKGDIVMTVYQGNLVYAKQTEGK